MSEFILLMPTMFGEQFYPMGFPVRPEDLNIEGVSVEQRYLRSIFPEQEEVFKPTDEDLEIICNYIRYYLRAPIWANSLALMEINVELDRLSKLNYGDLLDICFESALDPF